MNYGFLFEDILIPSEYYNKARASIPQDHSHRDELISLLIDQVLDDHYN
jgi:hypothetical protein